MNINNIGKYAVYRKCEQLLVMEDLTPEILSVFTKTVNEKNRRIKMLIQQGIEEQIFKDEPVDNLAAAAIGLVLGDFDIILAEGIKPSEELYSLMENMILKGFMR